MPEKPDEKSARPSRPLRKLTPAANRALTEAAERRKAIASKSATRVKETGGRDGPEPVRYGDWEKGGLASAF